MPEHLLIQQTGIYEGILRAGQRLSELPMSKGGWAEYFTECEDGDLRINDPILRSQTAIILENEKRWAAMAAHGRRAVNEDGLLVLDEATVSTMVGGWSDYLFPVLRSSFPNNAINDICSVQPTNRRVATIMYWNFVVGGELSKGTYYPGQRIYDANRGAMDLNGMYFASEYINGETIGTGNGATNPTLTTLRYRDGGGVRPGTVRVMAVVASVVVEAFDNGNGGWLGGLAGAIDYRTGALSITWGGNTDAGQPIMAFYRWNSEGSSLLPQMDVQVTSTTVETERWGMRINYSREAQFDMLQELGISLEPEIVSAASAKISDEQARKILHEIWTLAPVVGTFPVTGPSEYSQAEHFNDIKYPLNAASNRIWGRTQKGYGNWIVVDELAANLIESLPTGWVAAPRPANPSGLHFIGTLHGKFRVYKDLGLVNEPNASAYGNMLMGFKGNEFWEAGVVWSPYLLLYTTDTLETADFMRQKGMASRAAMKVVNPDFFVRINLAA
jgi:hypothetical protein